LDKLGQHQHIETVLHSYDSLIERFLRFVPSPFSKAIETEDILSQTTFFITPNTCPLTSFLYSCADTNTELLFIYTAHALYNMLTAITILEEFGIKHNNINETSVQVDRHLNVVLCGFEFASKVGSSKNNRTVRDINDYINISNVNKEEKVSKKLPCRIKAKVLAQNILFV